MIDYMYLKLLNEHDISEYSHRKICRLRSAEDSVYHKRAVRYHSCTANTDCSQSGRQGSSTEDLLLHRRESSLAASRAIQLLKH